MFKVIVLIRNLILAAILAWPGLEFAPDNRDAPESAPQDSVIASVFG